MSSAEHENSGGRDAESQKWALPADIDLFVRLNAFFLILLMLLTWRLWFWTSSFPAVPLAKGLIAIPPFVDRIFAIALLVGCVLLVARGNKHRWMTAGCSFLLLSLFLLNQHRLQPWAYLACISLGICAVGPAHVALNATRAVIVSVYAYSAWNKFDFAFYHSIGQLFGATIAGWFQITWADLTPPARNAVVTLLPLTEFAAAITLAWPPTRYVGFALSISMHFVLIGLLGPFGLNHHTAVLVWNLQFAFMVYVLFVRPKRRRSSHSSEGLDLPPARQVRSVVAVAGAVLVICLPLAEPWGYWDHWPSWGLYSARPSHVWMYIRAGKRERLPPSLARHLEPSAWQGLWYRLRVDRWSLAQTDAPLYPQDRFQLGVVAALERRYGLQAGDLLLRHFRPPDRWAGHRCERRGDSPTDATWQDEFLLNYQPRSASRRPE